jgi:hypothetical protein
VTFRSTAQTRRGLVLGLVLIAAFELVAATIPDHVGDEPPYCRDGLKVKAEQVAQTCEFDLLIFGECYAYDGIVPEIIEKGTGLTTYNLSVNRGHLWLSNYVLFERYLGTAARKPRVVVLEVAPGAVAWQDFDVPILFEANVLPLLGASFDVFRAANWEGRVALLTSLVCPPSVRKQYFLKRADWLPTLLTYDHSRYRLEMERWRAARGHYDKARDPVQAPVPRDLVLQPAERDYDVNAFNSGFITRTIDLAARHEIPVVVFTPATCEALGRAWHRHGVKDRHRAWLENVRARHPNVLAIIDLMDVTLPSEFVPDSYHPNREGAIMLSRIVATRLREELAAAGLWREP